MMVNHIANLLSKNESHGSKIALIFNKESKTYSDLANEVGEYVGTIINHTLVGDRVLILSGNTPKTIIAFFACIASERIPVIADATASKEKIDYIIDDCQPTMVIREEGDPEIRTNADAMQFLDIPTLILYTSGSTGEPKGVVCHNSSMCAAVNAINEYMPLTEEDVILNTLPFNHSYGLYQMLTIFDACGTLVLMKKSAWTFPMVVVKKVKEHNVTVLPVAPTSIALLFKLREDKFELLKSLRIITTAGANFPEHHCEKLQKLLPDTSIIPMYGATECVRISYRPPNANKPGSCGINIPNQKTMIIDEESNELLDGEIGQLIVKGPHVMSYYLNKPELTAKTFREGWLYTGDMFSKDEDGYLYFAGRNDDTIKIKGEKVSPIEIEAQLNTIPGITQAIVTPAPDDLVGNVIVAHIVCDAEKVNDEIQNNAIMNYIKANLNLDATLIPKRILRWVTFPLVEGTSKINRKELKEAGLADLEKNKEFFK